MMDFRTFVSESPDDVYRNPGAVTFVHVGSADDITSAIFADREVWDGIRGREPWDAEAEIEAALESLPYPCMVASDGPRRTDVAVVGMNGRKAVLKGTTWPMSTHNLLIGALVKRALTERLLGGKFSTVPASYGKFRGTLESIINAMDTTGVGLQGRFTSTYLATWKEADIATVQGIMDVAEGAGLVRFADRVTVDTTGNLDSDKDTYPITRRKTGRFAS